MHPTQLILDNRNSAPSHQQPSSPSMAKSRKKVDKKIKLDRKSSRGMIYENEELRLRTININAEVERGQSDIKRLKKENELLRREIWTLRDECDRLGKKVKTKFLARETAPCGPGGSTQCNCRRTTTTTTTTNTTTMTITGGKNGYDYSTGHHPNSNLQCQCQCQCQMQSCKESRYTVSAANDGVETTTTTTTTTASTTTNRDASKVPIGGCLDAEILSVSCEPFSNSSSETNPDNGSYSVINGSSSVLTTFQPLAAVAEEECQESDDSQTLLSSLVCPLTPIETVANELHDLQTIAPPLSYFENVVRGHMTSSSETVSPASDSSKTNTNNNNWDHNIQSAFATKFFPPTSITIRTNTSISTNATPTLTTFVSSNGNLNTISPTLSKESTITMSIRSDTPTKMPESCINTVSSTTARINSRSTNNQPLSSMNINENAHYGAGRTFLSPLKSRLKLNTSLANQRGNVLVPVSMPEVPTTISPSSLYATGTATCLHNEQTSCMKGPTDVTVINGLSTNSCKTSFNSTTDCHYQSSSTVQLQNLSESANLDDILNDIKNITDNIWSLKLNKPPCPEHVSTENISVSTGAQNALEKNTKPYKSEMNLLLSYDGDDGDDGDDKNPSIIPSINKKDPKQFTSKSDSASHDELDTDHCSKSLNYASDDSPLTNVPNPMSPLPSNRQYLHLNSSLRSKEYPMATTNTDTPKSIIDTSSKIRGFTSLRPLQLYPFEHQPLKPLKNEETNVTDTTLLEEDKPTDESSLNQSSTICSGIPISKSSSNLASNCVRSDTFLGRPCSNGYIENVPVTVPVTCSGMINENFHHHLCPEKNTHNILSSHSQHSSNSILSDETCSSSSLSIPSNRRKLSINSYSTTKIPWCGCWGNGCL